MRLKDKLQRMPQMKRGDPAPVSQPEPQPEPELAHDPETGEVLSPGESNAPAERTERVDRLRAQLNFMANAQRVFQRHEPKPKPSWGPDEAEPPGVDEETPWGVLRKVHTEFHSEHRHGQAPLSAALSVDAQEISILALDPQLADVNLDGALYVDTETTGLSGGSGTLPFLIGAAWFEQGRLQVEQSLLRKPGQEAPMLRRLAERMAEATCLVSYNGKSFDWPLLRTRFILNRVPVPHVPPHLDLLHCARRVFKRRLGAVRLVHLEEQVLGFERVDDVPGELIPRTYLDFVRGRAPGAALAGIVEHNVHDLVALAAFLGELSKRFRQDGQDQDARDSLGFAEVAARAQEPERAIALAEAAADADVRGQLAPQALFLAGKLAQRRGDLPAAVDAFTRAVEAAGDDLSAAGPARLALAKLYEHKLKDLTLALHHAEHCASEEGEEACNKRRARLRKRLERGAAQQRLERL